MAFILPRDSGTIPEQPVLTLSPSLLQVFRLRSVDWGPRQVSPLVTFLRDVCYGGRGHWVWALPPTQGVGCE